MKKYNLVSTILVVVIFATVGAIIRPSSVHSVQDPNAKRDRVAVRRVTSSEPFELIEPLVKGRKISFGQKFEETGDWLQSLQFKIRNKSDKQIIYIRVLLTFPETQSPGNPMRAYDVYFGQKPNERIHRSSPLLLSRGDIVNFALSQKQIENIDSLLQGGGFSGADITRLEFWIAEVVFADGLMWRGGNLFHQDPSNPERWVRIP